MIVWILVVTVFLQGDNVLTKAMPGLEQDACMEAGGTVTHDLLGQKITDSEGEGHLVLDAQFQCVKFEKGDNA